MRGLAPSLALALAAAGAAGCAGTLRYPGTSNYEVSMDFDGRRPADVAVLPIAGEVDPEHAAALREALRERPLELRYAPVQVREVDASVNDFRPGGANAVLEVNVTGWDSSGLYGDGTLKATAQVRLFAAGSTDVLYRGEMKDVAVKAADVAHRLEDRPTTIFQAASEVAAKLLDKLPAKGDG